MLEEVMTKQKYETDTTNIIAKLLFVVGSLMIIASLLFAFVQASQIGLNHNFSFNVFLFYLSVGLVISLIFFAIGEIIKKLDHIDKRLYNKGWYIDSEVDHDEKQIL
ncbi:hypothetical protein ACTWQB_07735 [Piscibacillus sp. B03]|uniref:hypothetical protein n=1 Tax=Piscibacillus sp. B03 TaxID=3457430 RepID=UPI003FCEA2DE